MRVLCLYTYIGHIQCSTTYFNFATCLFSGLKISFLNLDKFLNSSSSNNIVVNRLPCFPLVDIILSLKSTLFTFDSSSFFIILDSLSSNLSSSLLEVFFLFKFDFSSSFFGHLSIVSGLFNISFGTSKPRRPLTS